MTTMEHVLRMFTRLASPIAGRIAPVRWKEFNEMLYWRMRAREEHVLGNDHYEYFYTTHFGIDPAFYRGKTLLDLGCGPRGSLEWATMAARRVGLDPLADEYLKLGASKHSMEYIAAPSEHIPLEDASCDAVFSFNSLDHVEDVGRTLSEIKRVTRPGGLFLLLVEVNHPPTACEPHRLRPEELVTWLAPEFTAHDATLYRPEAPGMYESVRADDTIARPLASSEKGYLSARFMRVGSN